MIGFIKNKNLQDYHRSLLLLYYMLYFTVFIKKFFKTVGEQLHLLKLHPKLIFRGALKKALIVLEDISYQTHFFAKIFPRPLALTLHIHFYLHLKESSENVLWIAIALKTATFSAPESAPETAFETYFMLFLKNLTKTFGEKTGDYVYFDGIDQFYKYFVFSAGQILCYWEKLPNHACKNRVYEALHSFPHESLQIINIC